MLHDFLIAGIIGVLICIGVYFWMKKRETLRNNTIDSITYPIYELKNTYPEAYEYLTTQIKSKSILKGTEEYLSNHLNKRNIQKKATDITT